MIPQTFFTISLISFCAIYSTIAQTSSKKVCEIILEDEIYVEKYDSSRIAKGTYDADNKIYVNGSVFVYDYYYQDLGGKKFKFQPDERLDMTYEERRKAWHFVSLDSVDEKTIDLIKLSIDTNSNDVLYAFPGFNQTVITYDYLLRDGSQELFEGTGIIENEKNIWLHPPRNKMFAILEINPFPFIQTPYETGNKWSWTLNNVKGTSWSDERWNSWDGLIEITSTYEITGKQFLDTPLGVLECFVIQSTGSSPLGKTYLTAYFNVDAGFVKLDYTNIDSTKLVMEILVHSNQNN